MLRIACLLALVSITSTAVAAPPNDVCSAPTPLTGFFFEDTGDLSPATTALDDPLQSCSKGGPNQNGHSIWYSFTAPSDGNFGLSTSGAGFDTVVTIHTGTCGALIEIACEDDVGSTQTAAPAARVTAGQTVLVAVTAFGSDPGGNPQVHGSFTPDSPLCGDGGSAFDTKLSIRHVGPPFGDEQISFKAELRLDDPPVPGPPIVPSDRGVQILIEESDAFAPVFELSQRTMPIPGNTPGCGPDDGWQVHAPRFRYRNLSNALPVGCVAGSANGLRQVDVKAIPPADVPRFAVKLKTKVANVPVPTGATALRTTVVLDATTTAPHLCVVSFDSCRRSGTTLRCGR